MTNVIKKGTTLIEEVKKLRKKRIYTRNGITLIEIKMLRKKRIDTRNGITLIEISKVLLNSIGSV